MDIRFRGESSFTSEGLDRIRGVVPDETYKTVFVGICDIITKLLSEHELEERQDAFNGLFDLLKSEVADKMNNEPKPDFVIEALEKYGKELTLIKVQIPGRTEHRIEIFGDALFVDGEQIGGV